MTTESASKANILDILLLIIFEPRCLLRVYNANAFSSALLVYKLISEDPRLTYS